MPEVLAKGQCTAGHWWQRVPTGALSGQLCPSWWEQRERLCLPARSWQGFSTVPVCPSVPAATRLSHHALCAPPCWWCSWPLEIPKGFFYPLEEGLARCSWSCQPLWHELQAAVGPPLSFPSSGSSPMHLTGALHSQSCHRSTPQPISGSRATHLSNFSRMRSGTFAQDAPLPLLHF